MTDSTKPALPGATPWLAWALPILATVLGAVSVYVGHQLLFEQIMSNRNNTSVGVAVPFTFLIPIALLIIAAPTAAVLLARRSHARFLAGAPGGPKFAKPKPGPMLIAIIAVASLVGAITLHLLMTMLDLQLPAGARLEPGPGVLAVQNFLRALAVMAIAGYIALAIASGRIKPAAAAQPWQPAGQPNPGEQTLPDEGQRPTQA